MSRAVIEVNQLSKAYQIGQFNTGTLSKDLERWWITRVRGKEDPFLKVGEVNRRDKSGTSNVVWSLRDINFSIGQGEAVGIIGKNGAGKSTLLKLLSRVTAPTLGNIKVKGRIASLLEVGTGFHPELSGRENIYLNGAILGMRKREISRKLEEIVDFSGVERYIDTPVKRYSSGMYVRLAFAVAAHLEPEILVVDEVLAVGDAEFQKKAIGKMKEVNKEGGRTVLFVSHNMESILALTRKCILLRDGSVEMEGESNDVIDSYLNRFTQGIKFEKVYDRSNWVPNQAEHLTRKLLLKEIKILNEKNTISVNESLRLQIKIKSQVQVTLNEVFIGFRLSNFFDEHICTGLTDAGVTLLPQEERELAVEISKLNVPPGGYKFAVWIGKGNLSNYGEDYDSVFDVIAINAYNETSFKWVKGWGKSILPDIKVLEPGNE